MRAVSHTPADSVLSGALAGQKFGAKPCWCALCAAWSVAPQPAGSSCDPMDWRRDQRRV